MGSGTYGCVYEARHIDTNYQVAIKEISVDLNSKISSQMILMLCREIVILKKLTQEINNNFTVNLIDAFVNEEAQSDFSKLTKVYLVMDFYQHDLSTLLR